ncbi:hypothetical protein ACWEWI_25775 [Streptomyces sp. NPDC003753]
MLPKSKVDLYAAIRRDARTGMSTRALMRKFGVGYETVQRALISALPEPRKKMRPRATRLDPYKPVIDTILKADLTAPRKQRHTVKRIYDRLLDEHEAVDTPSASGSRRGFLDNLLDFLGEAPVGYSNAMISPDPAIIRPVTG